MHTDDFDYPLPPNLIAQFPATERTASKLLAVPSDDAPPTILRFAEIGNLLRPGDLLVANDTRVLPARLFARKPSGGKVEIFLERILGDNNALVQLRANKLIRPPQTLLLDDIRLFICERQDEFFIMHCDDCEPTTLFQSHGVMPLPPYISRAPTAEDFTRYQTVYANANGAVAAPTAGLHFDQQLINDLCQAGIRWTTVTLHVGAGTFQPVREASPAQHIMHREWLEVSAKVCDEIAQTKTNGGRVIAVGTTVIRALESAAQSSSQDNQPCQPYTGDTELFILPGYNFRAVDALITNFHLPRSTLLMLVCAFAGKTKTLQAYHQAIQNNLRFHSYGDAMFTERAV